MKNKNKLKTLLKTNKKTVRSMANEISVWYRDCTGMNTWLSSYNDEAKILFLLARGHRLIDCIFAVYDKKE